MQWESILSKYIDEPFEVRCCKVSVHGGPLLVSCNLTSKGDSVMCCMYLDENGIVVKVEREKRIKSKVIWEEMTSHGPESSEQQ